MSVKKANPGVTTVPPCLHTPADADDGLHLNGQPAVVVGFAFRIALEVERRAATLPERADRPSRNHQCSFGSSKGELGMGLGTSKWLIGST
jgi:hypothetical protein